MDGIQFNGLRFEKEDKTEAQRQARKLAFENARKKASDYASLSGGTLGKVLTITDNCFSSPAPIYRSADTFAVKSVGTEVPVEDQ